MSRRVRDPRDGGSASLELVLLAPAVLALLGLVVVAARLQAVHSGVEQAAAAAARTASLARTPEAARATAERVALENLRGDDVACRSPRVAVDTSGFGREAGLTAEVSVEVTCDVRLSDQAVPGMPGSRVVSYRAASPLDRYRAR